MCVYCCILQAGYLEKALEISNWAMAKGLEFNSSTYRELMETIEVAQIWDQKALRGTRPGGFLQVRPAGPFLFSPCFAGVMMVPKDHARI